MSEEGELVIEGIKLAFFAVTAAVIIIVLIISPTLAEIPRSPESIAYQVEAAILKAVALGDGGKAYIKLPKGTCTVYVRGRVVEVRTPKGSFSTVLSVDASVGECRIYCDRRAEIKVEVRNKGGVVKLC
jgi:hypothetical protein